MRAYNASVRSVLLCGAETWPATQSVLSIINIAQKNLRRIEGLRWHDFVGNEKHLVLTAQTSFTIQLAQQTLRWYGHLLRIPPDTPSRTIFDFDPVLHGRKRQRDDLTHRTAKASAVVGRLSALWMIPSISRRTKMRIYNASVGSVLLYGAETWPATQSVLSTVNIAQKRIFAALKDYADTILLCNEKLLALTAQTPFAIQLAQRTLPWYGHLLRIPPYTLSRMIFDFDPVLHGERRPRGYPPTRWKDTAGAFLAMTNTQEDVHILARYRCK